MTCLAKAHVHFEIWIGWIVMKNLKQNSNQTKYKVATVIIKRLIPFSLSLYYVWNPRVWWKLKELLHILVSLLRVLFERFWKICCYLIAASPWLPTIHATHIPYLLHLQVKYCCKDSCIHISHVCLEPQEELLKVEFHPKLKLWSSKLYICVHEC